MSAAVFVPTSRPSLSLAVAVPRPATLLLMWVVGRTALWAAIACLQPNPPLDTVEWLCWGREWQLGYHKHPPLAAWIGDVACRLTPGSFAGAYLAGYLCVALGLWSAWRLASDVLPARLALLAVVCLDGLVFVGPGGAEFCNSQPLVGFWAWAVWRTWRATRTGRTADWAVAGLAGGLTLMCKLSALMLLGCLAVAALLHARRHCRGLLVAAAVVAVVCLPHLLWSLAHDFPTRRWAVMRAAGGSGSFDNHLGGLTWTLSQLFRLVPVVLVLLPALLATDRRRWASLDAVRFLVVAAVGPAALTAATGVVGGMHLRDIWGFPLWTFAGVTLLTVLKAGYGDKSYCRCLQIAVGASLSMQAFFAWPILAGTKPLRVHYPGEEVARMLTERATLPPAVVAGDWWIAGNVCLFSPHRPTLYGSLEPSRDRMRPDVREPGRFYEPDAVGSPWTSDEDFRRRGGVLVWDAAVFGDAVPAELRERYPEAVGRGVVDAAYRGGREGVVRVGWAEITAKETSGK